jgi:choline monooxygenase
MANAAMSDREARSKLDAILGPEAISRLEGPVETAAALPNAAYTSAAFLELENARLFARTWMLAGFAHEIPEPGDVRPTNVAGEPVILVRCRDGEIRAFHNVCRHRGSRLVAEPCQGRKTLVCPYHAWTYGLDGRLLTRPHFHGPGAHDIVEPGNGDGAKWGLKPVRTALWRDLVFADLSGSAPPLEEHLKPMTERLAGYRLDALGYAGKLEFEIKANWKLIHENFIENYHVFAVHPKLTDFVPMERRNPSSHDGYCLWNDYRFPQPEPGRGEGLPYYPDLPEDLADRGLWFHFFPCLDIELWPDQFAVFRVTPLGPTRTREEIHVYLIGEAAQSERYRDGRQGVFDMWRELNREDIAVLENLQAGRASSAFDGGCFSPHWEAANHHLCRLVVEGIARES